MSPGTVSRQRSLATALTAAFPAEDTAAERAVMLVVQPRSRVAVLGNWPRLLERLAAAGCTPLELPALEPHREPSLTAFGADTLVVAEGVPAAELDALLDLLAREPAVAGEVAVLFQNASGSSELLSALLGRRADQVSVPEDWLREGLARAGFIVRDRLAIAGARPRFPLSGDAERSLRKLFEQLNPSTEDDRLLYVARRSATATATRPLVPGLLSVVVRNHSLSRLALLDHTLFSLAGQSHRPLEIVLVTQAADADASERLQALLRRHHAYGGYESQVLQHVSHGDARARIANIGVEASRGQYVAFLDDDDVVYPDHYERLVSALQRGHSAWAFAPVRRAWFTHDAQGNLYCTKKDVFPGSDRWDVLQLIRENYITCHSYVIDRERVGRFRISFSEDLSKNEDYVLLLRMAALFRPIAVAGHPSCEYRIRDDGTNSIMESATSAEHAAHLHEEWRTAEALTRGIKRPLQMLISEGEFEQEVARALAAVQPPPPMATPAPAPPPFRHILVDKGNELLRLRAGWIHSALKRTALLAWMRRSP